MKRDAQLYPRMIGAVASDAGRDRIALRRSRAHSMGRPLWGYPVGAGRGSSADLSTARAKPSPGGIFPGVAGMLLFVLFPVPIPCRSASPTIHRPTRCRASRRPPTSGTKRFADDASVYSYAVAARAASTSLALEDK